jgi:hypothetical protein
MDKFDRQNIEERFTGEWDREATHDEAIEAIALEQWRDALEENLRREQKQRDNAFNRAVEMYLLGGE